METASVVGLGFLHPHLLEFARERLFGILGFSLGFITGVVYCRARREPQGRPALIDAQLS